MLIFFDIDATLITSGGAGIKAMIDAGRDLYGPSFTADGVPFAGRLDPLILVDMLALNGQPVTAANLAAMRDSYRRRLADRLAPGAVRTLPGVMPLLDALAGHEDLALGLLTGNFEETGSLKLRNGGIDPDRFHIRVWGDDSPHRPPTRDHLPGVGLTRYHARFGRPADPARVTVIGDTPHDAACARAHQCRSLGVATGQFTTDQLLAAGADRAVPNLADTADIAAWLSA